MTTTPYDLLSSDWHIGSRCCNYDALLGFLNFALSEPIKRFIVAGDLQNDDVIVEDSGVRAVREKIRILEYEKEVPFLWIKGNHDFKVGKIHGPHWFLSSGHLFAVDHGNHYDPLCKSDGHGFWTDAYDWVQERIATVPKVGLPLARRLKNWELSRVEERIDAGAGDFTRYNALTTLFLGHTHRAKVTNYNYINLGSFAEEHCYYVIVKDGAASFHQWC